MHGHLRAYFRHRNEVIEIYGLDSSGVAIIARGEEWTSCAPLELSLKDRFGTLNQAEKCRQIVLSLMEHNLGLKDRVGAKWLPHW